MKKKILGFVCGIVTLGMLTGCGNNLINNDENNKNEISKGNCTALECIKKIEPEYTVEQINNVIGFEGELTDEKYHKYYWELSEDTGVEVTYYSSDNGTIKIDYVREELANKKVNFSKYSDLKEKINDGITYNDFISYIGNVDGTIIEKSAYSTKYVWVSSNGGYLTGIFSKNTGKCTAAIGMIK